MPTHPGTLTLIEQYLEAAAHGHNQDAPLVRPVKNNVHGHTMTALTPDSTYLEVVLSYLKKVGIFGENMGSHVMRATAAPNARDNGADIAKLQEWLGYANIATIRIAGTIARRVWRCVPSIQAQKGGGDWSATVNLCG